MFFVNFLNKGEGGLGWEPVLFAARLVHLCNLGVVLVLVIAVYVTIARAGGGVDGAFSFLESAGRDLGGIC